ncbi:MAG: RsmB/NOP family class I SAM-dependent RNA methyltransferase [Roseburia sp.]|nr:RsmB/NOP family class I SAM-dependent RNA methyltransferase [Roseburia sp.]
MLPQDFVDRMKTMMGAEYEAFEQSYEHAKYQSLRINPLKVQKDIFLEKVPFNLTEVPWCENGYYYDAEDTPGKHPYHEAGVYYIQEPSAMAPVEYLDVKPGERILDLCAAPGGKSTQIATKMQGKGMFICNEIHPARAKILSENIERLGITNAVVLNETPARLAELFEGYFDKILVDAPCSGEGMFRKNEDACGEWSLENVRICGERQDEILECAASMLKPGGRIVYSTCTFAPMENEGSIYRFLNCHTNFHTIPAKSYEGMSAGNLDWYINDKTAGSMEESVRDDMAEQIANTIRLWPHLLKGEGHYLAVLEKDGQLSDYQGYCKNPPEKGISDKDCEEFLQFCKENLREIPTGNKIKFGDQIYLIPEEMPSLKGIKVLRPGLHLGTLKKNRFEPSHALALALHKEDVLHTVSYTADSYEIKAYLKGQTLNLDGEKGWYLINADDYSIGWAKLAGSVLKNHYPKGLRMM